MARFRDSDAACTEKDHRATRQKKRTGQNMHEHGPDPWSIARRADAVVKSETTSACASGTAKSNSDDHNDKDDGVAEPTPIRATRPCKIIAADGREAMIYTPIDGFEHLFKDIPCSPPAPVQPQIQAPDTSRRHSNTTHYAAQRPLAREQRPRRATTPNVASTPVNKPAPTRSRRRALKRSRSVAQGLSYLCNVSAGVGGDDGGSDDDEPMVTNVTTRTFRMGDLAELKLFLRYRLDELTMKPIRPIVTAWIKQLEPRRLGEYGPYHKRLPAKAPSEATPPWWPEEVVYNEPSHLSKSGLLNLAVDIMLQHRPKDEIKRRGGWTAKLRQAAQYAVDMTPPELFSSSEDPKFSLLMRDRARDLVLPSLFDVAQSYEDYVFQTNLWELDDTSSIPRGKSITWQPISRPPRRSAQRKRVRKARELSLPKKESDVDSSLDASGDETEVDDTMEMMATRQVRQPQSCYSRQRAASKSHGVRTGNAPESKAPEATTPTMIRAAPPQVFHTQSVHTSPQSSFDQSMTRLQLSEDVKGDSVAQITDQTQRMGEHAMSMDQKPHYAGDQSGYIATNDNNAYQPQHSATTYDQADQGPLLPFEAQQFVNPTMFPMFPSTYPIHMDHPAFTHPLPLNTTGYPYDRNGVFSDAALDITALPPQSSTSFNGLPYAYNFNDSCQQQHYCGSPIPTTRG